MRIGQVKKSGNTRLSRGLWKLRAVARTMPELGSVEWLKGEEYKTRHSRRATSRGVYVTPAGVAKIGEVTK